MEKNLVHSFWKGSQYYQPDFSDICGLGFVWKGDLAQRRFLDLTEALKGLLN